MIEVENLTKYYGEIRGIEDVSFSIKKGEITGFLGPNGSGKTTTMRILTCFFPPNSGRARVAGYDVIENPIEVRRRIGYVPETVPLYPDMKVKTYLNFVAEAKRMEKGQRRRKINEIMEQCGILGVSHRLVGNLSKGYRQRVGLAQALINDPEVLILDEPTIGLDPKQVVEIRQFIKNLAGERTIILSTHILSEVSMTCERVIIIHEGKIVAVDTPENLMGRLQKTSRTLIQIEGGQQEVKDKLKTIPGVINILEKGESSPGVFFYEVESEKEREISGALSYLVYSNNWKLVEMRAMKMSLENIFIELTKEDKV
ncbi:MAG: ATP-binding cassette domain-containing protein [Deltaproteobacteria bacterium]|nr:ATP-binding cassette domain-containing protein [Deltaproteobacteria bacterium]